jgi:hypothetical protein
MVGGGGTENCSLYFQFDVKYILFVNSYTALSAMPVQYYAYIGPPDLFFHWARKCLKAATERIYGKPSKQRTLSNSVVVGEVSCCVSFNDTVNSQIYTASMTDERNMME